MTENMPTYHAPSGKGAGVTGDSDGIRAAHGRPETTGLRIGGHPAGEQ